MVKHPAAMSNQRARGLGSAIAAVATAMPAFGVFLVAFLALVLVDLAAVFLLELVFLVVVFLTVGAFLVVDEVLTETAGSCRMLAAPAVGCSVQAQTPLMSAQAWPVFAIPYESETSTIVPKGSKTCTAEPPFGNAKLVSAEKNALYAPGAIVTSPMV